MTNGEKYKTAQEREAAFRKFCDSQETCTMECPMHRNKVTSQKWQCAIAWLDLEAEEEKPLPCIWCKGEMQHVKEGSGHFLACVYCNHTTREYETKEELVREYNRMANAVMKSENASDAKGDK